MIEINLQKILQSAEGVMELNLELEIKKGQLVTLFGDSGAGKSSTLRMISGLLKPDKGTISVNGNSWYDKSKKINIAPQKRKVGFVFQDFALFPNMTVLQNLQFAKQKKEASSIISELLEFMELTELQNRKPETLSGGQKQKVALARALVQKPEILLLDEPLSALDNKMRIKLQEYILKIHRKYELTTVLVSHDIGEIMKLSDLVFELQNGKVIKKGNASDFFGFNKSSAKFRFTGEIISIEKEDVIYVISVLIGNDILKIVSDISEVKEFLVGDKVLVASKAFNPSIQKI